VKLRLHLDLQDGEHSTGGFAAVSSLLRSVAAFFCGIFDSGRATLALNLHLRCAVAAARRVRQISEQSVGNGGEMPCEGGWSREKEMLAGW
jgi:hypothetical protein